MTVQIIKLTNGETIMCDIINPSSPLLEIANPLELRTEPNQDGTRMSMMAHQWLPLFEEVNIMYLHEQHIVGMAYASEELQEYYVEALERILEPEKYMEKEIEERIKLKKMIDELKELRDNANTNSELYH